MAPPVDAAAPHPPRAPGTGADDDPQDHAYDTLYDLQRSRYSCRAFLPRALERSTIERVLTAAQRTASWCNAQPWQLTMTSGETLAHLREALQAHVATATPTPDMAWPREYRGIYQERRRDCGWGLYDAVGIAKGDRDASARQAALNFSMFGAPHVAIVTSDEALGAYGAVDCGAYVSQFMLAAHSLGVGSIAQAALAAYPGVLRDVLGITADRVIVCGISFGWPDMAHPANQYRTPRADIASAVVWRD